MERVQFIEHGGKQVLLADFSHGTGKELIDVFDEVQEVVTAQPPGSVLVLADFTGAEVTKSAADRMKVTAVMDRPHVKRAAIVGADSMPEVFYKALSTFSGRSFPTFPTRAEALAWLVQS